jgi:hypothetical protein
MESRQVLRAHCRTRVAPTQFGGPSRRRRPRRRGCRDRGVDAAVVAGQIVRPDASHPAPPPGGSDSRSRSRLRTYASSSSHQPKAPRGRPALTYCDTPRAPGVIDFTLRVAVLANRRPGPGSARCDIGTRSVRAAGEADPRPDIAVDQRDRVDDLDLPRPRQQPSNFGEKDRWRCGYASCRNPPA